MAARKHRRHLLHARPGQDLEPQRYIAGHQPRGMAGAIGIQLLHSRDELRAADRALGDQRSFFLVERYIAGDVCHVDSIVYQNQILFAVASQYGYPPLDVSHRGGIFTTRLLERGSALAEALLAANEGVLAAMGLLRGVSHTEFIKGDDGSLYFLETSARVGGAHIAERQAALCAAATRQRLRRAARLARQARTSGHLGL